MISSSEQYSYQKIKNLIKLEKNSCEVIKE